jgi:hypothetical protein
MLVCSRGVGVWVDGIFIQRGRAYLLSTDSIQSIRRYSGYRRLRLDETDVNLGSLRWVRRQTDGRWMVDVGIMLRVALLRPKAMTYVRGSVVAVVNYCDW